MSEAFALGSIAYASREVQIHRVRYRPDVWQWTPWQYAVDQLATPTGRPVTGIEFSSRHADNCRLWAVFERDADTNLAIVPTPMNEPVNPFDPDLVEAMRLLDVEWAN
ncbi:hypothetical protein QEN35_13305 [Gordonia alkanivorans]|uniref:hypothetical protein n=1 Tax=Gordonia alkanivorans TaxID=84096 RepID=UPI002447892A|nr:hypothetical protein [Gordonia alkanivorans]MDH3025363.1 hypothetical protein [Gordonia alkanivorans]